MFPGDNCIFKNLVPIRLAPAFTFSLELLQLFVGHKKVGIANSLEILGKDEQQTFQHCCESGIIYSGSGTSSDI